MSIASDHALACAHPGCFQFQLKIAVFIPTHLMNFHGMHKIKVCTVARMVTSAACHCKTCSFQTDSGFTFIQTSDCKLAHGVANIRKVHEANTVFIKRRSSNMRERKIAFSAKNQVLSLNNVKQGF